MTVFKTFLKVLKQCKVPVILYTVFLIGFGGFNMQTSDVAVGFTASRPEILILNHDAEHDFTEGLVKYMEENCTIADIKDDEEAISDALFYRDIQYIISIPEKYGERFMNGEEPELEVRSAGDYQASYAEMLLSRYVKTASIYLEYSKDEQEISDAVQEVLGKQAEIEIASKLDTDQLSKAGFYYNFMNYSLLAGCVYVICLILSSFKSEGVHKRTIISSMNMRKFNRELLFSNSGFAIMLWLLYVLLSFVLVGNSMFTAQGALFILNSFLFTLCALTIAFLIGNLVKNKNAINGIVNVVALGSSFLCGAFVPAEWLPDSVLRIARVLPSYWYIQSNEKIKVLEAVTIESVRPILINMGVVLAFSFLFMFLSNLASKRSQKIG